MGKCLCIAGDVSQVPDTFWDKATGLIMNTILRVKKPSVDYLSVQGRHSGDEAMEVECALTTGVDGTTSKTHCTLYDQ